MSYETQTVSGRTVFSPTYKEGSIRRVSHTFKSIWIQKLFLDRETLAQPEHCPTLMME